MGALRGQLMSDSIFRQLGSQEQSLDVRMYLNDLVFRSVDDGTFSDVAFDRDAVLRLNAALVEWLGEDN